MDRRTFLASLAVPFVAGQSPPKELVLDYLSKDPSLMRAIVLDPQGGVSTFVTKEIGGVLYAHYDAKHAWVLPDGRLEVERYLLVPDEDAQCGVKCVMRDGEPATYTTVLDVWTLRVVDNKGQTISERHSQRT